MLSATQLPNNQNFYSLAADHTWSLRTSVASPHKAGNHTPRSFH